MNKKYIVRLTTEEQKAHLRKCWVIPPKQNAEFVAHMATLQQEAKAWYRKRNANQKPVDWHFTSDDARIKLKKLYPQIQML